MKSRLLLVVACALSVVLAHAGPPAGVPEDRGAMGLSQALKRLDVIVSALHTGAHPDDESSALMSWLSRGIGARTAYMAINRGEGGQNLIGPELFEELGVIRTEELLAARRFDRAEQFFTPNMDFGYSKTADESFEQWGHANVLGDFVRVIRQFRPEVIFSRFTGTANDGHGHHQVAGIVSEEAFKAAADPTRFPEYGKPWQVKKLYVNGMGGAPGATITVNTGEFDTALGRSYAEIAGEGRSLHRSQGEGAARPKGPTTMNLRLVQKTVDTPDNTPFAGVLYKIADLAQLEPALATDLNALQRAIDDVRGKMSVMQPAASVPALLDLLNRVRAIRSKATHEHVRFLLDLKIPDFEEAARLAAGVVVDAVASDDTVTPGQAFTLTVSVINGGPLEFPAPNVQLKLPANWTSTPQGPAGAARLAAGQKIDRRFQIQVPADAKFTEPYWLRQPRMGARFVWPEASPASLPFDGPVVSTRVDLDYSGTTVSANQPAEFRRTDNMLGELRSAVQVVPALSTRLEPEIAVVPLAGKREKTFTVTVENQNTANSVEAVVRLITPAGWTTKPAEQTVRFSRQGEKKSVSFTVAIPATAGDFTVRAVATSGGREFNEGYTTIAYPHIETHYIHAPAESKVEVFDVRTRVTSVGYVEGAGDRVPEALEQMGIAVTRLSAKDLASGDLSRFPAIVLGVRAYGQRSDLVASNARLLEYVNNGGTLIVQYNRANEVPNIQVGPYPFTLTSNNNFRVTREDAPMKILDAGNPVFNTPNRITAEDFNGWVQERGTYFLSQWDPHYTPLLSSNDPGEQPLLGGLVAAKYGKGLYIYTGYVFFRELPAGVKGAYRLFANLVSAQGQ